VILAQGLRFFPEPIGGNRTNSARSAGIDALLGVIKPKPPNFGARMTPSRDISRLIDIMAALRTPGSGCPWDLVQNFATIAPYTIEESL